MQSSLFAFHTRPLSSLFRRVFFHRALSFILSRLRPVFDRPPKKEDKDTMTDTPACPHGQETHNPVRVRRGLKLRLASFPFPQTPTAALATQTSTLLPPLPQRPARNAVAGPPTTLTQTPSQPRCRRSHAPVRNSTGQASDRIRLNQARPGQARLGQNRIRPGHAVDHAFDETSRPVSANFSARPGRKSIRDAIRADAVVDAVDADAGTRP